MSSASLLKTITSTEGEKKGPTFKPGLVTSHVTHFLFFLPLALLDQKRQEMRTTSDHLCGKDCLVSHWVYSQRWLRFLQMMFPSSQGRCILSRESINTRQDHLSVCNLISRVSCFSVCSILYIFTDILCLLEICSFWYTKRCITVREPRMSGKRHGVHVIQPYQRTEGMHHELHTLWLSYVVT